MCMLYYTVLCKDDNSPSVSLSSKTAPVFIHLFHLLSTWHIPASVRITCFFLLVCLFTVVPHLSLCVSGCLHVVLLSAWRFVPEHTHTHKKKHKLKHTIQRFHPVGFMTVTTNFLQGNVLEFLDNQQILSFLYKKYLFVKKVC